MQKQKPSRQTFRVLDPAAGKGCHQLNIKSQVATSAKITESYELPEGYVRVDTLYLHGDHTIRDGRIHHGTVRHVGPVALNKAAAEHLFLVPVTRTNELYRTRIAYEEERAVVADILPQLSEVEQNELEELMFRLDMRLRQDNVDLVHGFLPEFLGVPFVVYRRFSSGQDGGHVFYRDEILAVAYYKAQDGEVRAWVVTKTLCDKE